MRVLEVEIPSRSTLSMRVGGCQGENRTTEPLRCSNQFLERPDILRFPFQHGMHFDFPLQVLIRREQSRFDLALIEQEIQKAH